MKQAEKIAIKLIRLKLHFSFRSRPKITQVNLKIDNIYIYNFC